MFHSARLENFGIQEIKNVLKFQNVNQEHIGIQKLKDVLKFLNANLKHIGVIKENYALNIQHATKDFSFLDILQFVNKYYSVNKELILILFLKSVKDMIT